MKCKHLDYISNCGLTGVHDYEETGKEFNENLVVNIEKGK